MKELKTTTLSDMMPAYIEHEIERANKVKYEDGYIIINEKYPYEIPISKCDSYKKILGWIEQIADKNWCTTETIHDFIIVAHHASGLERQWTHGL